MSYNPVSSTVASDIKAEAAIYAVLYQTQYYKHIRYSWILWAIVAATVSFLCFYRVLKFLSKRSIISLERLFTRHTLFGFDLQTTRLQFVLLIAYTSYNIVFSFVDIPYGHSYRYTSKHAPGYVQKATTIQFIADRTGYLAFASLPLVFLLVTRYNLVSLASGISYTSFGLMHRWVGWTVFFLSWVHTLLWTIEMGVHYHMTGGYLATRWAMRYWLGGFFASLFMTWLVLHSLPMVRRYTGYEFFRITHNLGSILLIIGCWVHWPQESRWLIACVAVYYSDRVARWCMIAIRGVKSRGCTQLTGVVYTDADDISVAVLKIKQTGLTSWTVGDHVYIYCVSLGEWEPHPFSVANSGNTGNDLQLIVRRKAGLTNELITHLWVSKEPVNVLLDGPYGSFDKTLLDERHLLLIAGGTGISSILSALYACSEKKGRSIKLLWYVRRNCNLKWVEKDFQELSYKFGQSLQIELIVSREGALHELTTSQESQTFEKSSSHALHELGIVNTVHRDSSKSLEHSILDFVSQCNREPITVMGCGPGTMGAEIEQCAERQQQSTKTDIRWHVERYMM